ncbi:hypothetical protein HPULCUR_005374 [Helicostylum pulchrum]|uniref:Uncharacterized protein n=1 Tax=Helicostylum pulchrum TaxID=562976 RepID=A0ABP9XZS6_9FUNG
MPQSITAIAEVNAKKLACAAGNRLKRKLDDMLADESSSSSAAADLDCTNDSITAPETDDLSTELDTDNEDSNSTNLTHLQQTPLTYSAIKKVLITCANEIHQRYKNNQTINNKERQLMICGSSFILDLTEKSDIIFKTLFSETDWDKIISHFENDLLIQKAEIDQKILAKWDYGTGLGVLSNDIGNSQIYFASQFAASASKQQRSTIKLFTAVLDVFQNNGFILEQKQPNNVIEGDYVDQIWLPVFKGPLFAINGHLVGADKGETVIKNSTQQKSALYQSDSHVIGFKVDVRLIYDHGSSEFDIGAAEACLSEADDNKIVGDRAKLLREGKDNVDTLIKVSSGDIRSSWIIQISGLMAYICTVTYVGSDLFVGTLQNTITFPSSIGELNDQAKSLDFFNGLLQLRDNVENSAQIIKTHIYQANKTNTNINAKYSSLGPSPPPHTNQPSCQTWYSPPGHQPKRSIFPEYNYELLETGNDDLIDDLTDTCLPGYEEEDAFGFIKIDNEWYHPRLKKYFNQHPSA